MAHHPYWLSGPGTFARRRGISISEYIRNQTQNLISAHRILYPQTVALSSLRGNTPYTEDPTQPPGGVLLYILMKKARELSLRKQTAELWFTPLFASACRFSPRSKWAGALFILEQQ